MDSDAAEQQHLIPALPSPIKRKPIQTKHRDPNQRESHYLFDLGAGFPAQDDSGTPAFSKADISSNVSSNKPLFNYQAGVNPPAKLEEDKYAPRMKDEQNGFTRLYQDWWLMELLSLALSVSALAAIVSVLRAFENHSLPDWPYNITLNTFLALFTTILNTGLVMAVLEALSRLKWIWFMEEKRPPTDFQRYDDASRGGIVSDFKLLRALRGR
jgi:Protein of unknown function (DUF3176)